MKNIKKTEFSSSWEPAKHEVFRGAIGGISEARPNQGRAKYDPNLFKTLKINTLYSNSQIIDFQILKPLHNLYGPERVKKILPCRIFCVILQRIFE